MESKQKDLTVKFVMSPNSPVRELSKTGYEVLQRFKERDTLKVFPAMRRSHDLVQDHRVVKKEAAAGYARNSSERVTTEAAVRDRLRNQKTVFMNGQ